MIGKYGALYKLLTSIFFSFFYMTWSWPWPWFKILEDCHWPRCNTPQRFWICASLCVSTTWTGFGPQPLFPWWNWFPTCIHHVHCLCIGSKIGSTCKGAEFYQISTSLLDKLIRLYGFASSNDKQKNHLSSFPESFCVGVIFPFMQNNILCNQITGV